uniref:Uncharacterized protein n=1 Tax=Picea glauca TaxID=3330 RepID=A0A124GN50_PICGL|nr:hypothetical protein ABT39_MTgene5893 [Picea glauca]
MLLLSSAIQLSIAYPPAHRDVDWWARLGMSNRIDEHYVLPPIDMPV